MINTCLGFLPQRLHSTTDIPKPPNRGEKNINRSEYMAADSRNSFNIMSRTLQHGRGHYESTFQLLAFQSALGVNRRADQLSQLFPSHFKCCVEYCRQAKRCRLFYAAISERNGKACRDVVGGGGRRAQSGALTTILQRSRTPDIFGEQITLGQRVTNT